MSKIKSAYDLETFIDDEISYRKHEIALLKTDVKSKAQKSKYKKTEVFAKSLIVISYSHWEGFVKTVAKKYLEYIKFLGLDRSKLNDKLVSSIMFNNLCKSSTKTVDKIGHIHSVITDPHLKQDIDCVALSDTKSNLNSEVLEIIVSNIGLEPTSFITKYPYLDSVILKNRNDFAHGDRNKVDISTSTKIADTVIELMELFRTLIKNALATAAYKKTP